MSRFAGVYASLRYRAILASALALAACGPAVDDDDATDEPPPCINDGAPELTVYAVDDEQPAGFPVGVAAQAIDGDGISTVQVFFRVSGGGPFQSVFLTATEDDETIFVGEIPAESVQLPGVEFYVVAKDEVPACQEQTIAPEQAPKAVYGFSVRDDLVVLPFNEDFETGDAACGDQDVAQLGWTHVVDSFPQAVYGWQLEPNSPLSGECSATHDEGVPGGIWECPPPDGEGTILRQNWLISPAIDFRGKGDIAVRWFERETLSGPCLEAHRLYVSSGSPDPDDGEYELVSELPLPGAAWVGSAWYDLSAWAGSERVHVALHYEAGSAGRWQVDDFYVGEPLADIELAIATLDPADPEPGDAGLQLAVTLANVSDSYASPELSAVLTTADGDLTLVSDTTTLPALQPGQSAALAAPFVFDVQADHPDNSWLDFAIALSDGVHAWTVPLRLLMGQESTVRITTTTPGLAALDLELGYGFPVSPTFAVSSDAAFNAPPWELEITEHAARLPPGPGSKRWWLRVSNDSFATGFVDSVVFTVGGQQYAAALSPSLAVGPGEDALVYIPEPPKLTVDYIETDPGPAVPGATVVIEELALRNEGAATSGPVQCVLDSGDADVSGLSLQPVTFGAAPIGPGESVEADGPESFVVAATHVDDSPVALTLLCLDGVDTMPVPLAIDVPYARPRFSGWRIDDSCASCDGDGLLDGGENAEVWLQVTNQGARATAGDLSATISIGTGSTAGFTISAPVTVNFPSGLLAPGASAEATSSLGVSLDADALLGDTIVLDVQWSAGPDTWHQTVLLEATGLPWLDCPGGGDPEGDVLGNGQFDITGCRYRSDGTFLQVQFDSATQFTPSIAFVDFFFYEVPQTYTVESVGGSADFESDCVLGDDAVESVPIAVDVRGGRSASARIALADIGAIGNNTQIAFAAGSCPGTWFCDWYPDSAFNIDLIGSGTFACSGQSFIPINW